MTKNIGIAQFAPTIDPDKKVEIRRVLILRPNHRLGNLLLITPLLQEVIETLPQAKIDLFIKGGLGPIVLKNYSNINEIIALPKKPFKDLWKYIQGWMTIRRNQYDIVINVIYNSSSGRLSAKFANAKYKFFGDLDEATQLKFGDHQHLAKFPVYSFRNYMSRLRNAKNEPQIPSIDLKLSTAEIAEGKKLLDSIVDPGKKTISIFTFATDAKCYSPAWWSEFYNRLKKEYSDYNILEVLPVENVSQIAFEAPSYYSKEIREIGAVIANTEIFIGADSGMMHLASSSLTPTVGLFKITDTKVYEPYNNNSIAINTNNSNLDEWIKMIDKILTRK